MLLEQVAREESTAAWTTVRVDSIRQVEQSPLQIYSTGLQPVWHAKFTTKEGATGHLLWEITPPGRLIEFALDSPHPGPYAHHVAGVPNLQQFPVPGKTAALVASGCVPTSGADLIGYWIGKGMPHWAEGKARELPLAAEELKAITLRLRSRMPMQEFPDEAGYTENKMPLSGAMTRDLARAIREDAAAHGVKVKVEVEKFSMETVRREIEAGHPLVLTCTVRLPHKPSLSWQHAIAGVAWRTIDGAEFVGVHDNFFPVKNLRTIRWIRADAFRELMVVVPEG